ncbi:hypothetical protein C3488_05300 [Streptomyces sp. Ru72]|nr:hypothetical protein C3488_05300 [Streptomyces sp. Ru72]
MAPDRQPRKASDQQARPVGQGLRVGEKLQVGEGAENRVRLWIPSAAAEASTIPLCARKFSGGRERRALVRLLARGAACPADPLRGGRTGRASQRR